jgi:hypothetical protein
MQETFLSYVPSRKNEMNGETTRYDETQVALQHDLWPYKGIER